MTPDPRERFLTLLREALAARTLKRLVLSRPARPMFPPGFTNEGPVLQRLRIQPVRMRDGVKLAFAWQYDTRDQTDNLSVDEALVRIDALLGDMRTALLETRELTAEPRPTTCRWTRRWCGSIRCWATCARRFWKRAS